MKNLLKYGRIPYIIDIIVDGESINRMCEMEG